MGIRADMDHAVTLAAIGVVNRTLPSPTCWRLGCSAIKALAAEALEAVEAGEYQSLPIELTDEFQGWELVG